MQGGYLKILMNFYSILFSNLIPLAQSDCLDRYTYGKFHAGRQD